MQLNQPGRQAPTMSEMALQLGITKQQLTKLINDLEEKNLVRRQHGSRNRRHVYLMITPEGIHHEAAEGSHAGLHGVPPFLV